MNYFRMRDGKIAYMANFHDSVPFRPFLDQKLGLTDDGRVRLHRRRRGRRRLGRRQPADARTRTRKVLVLEAGGPDIPPNVHDAVALVHAARLRRRLEVLQRAAGRSRRPQDVRAARQAARRLQRLLHHDAHPRPPVRLRRLGRRRRDRAGRTRSACRTSRSSEDQEDDTEPMGRQRRAAARHQRRHARPEPDLARVHRRLPRARLSARPRTSTARTWRAPAGTTSTSSTASASAAAGPTSSPRSKRPNLTLRDERARHAPGHRGRALHRRRVPPGRPDPQGTRAGAR